MTQEEEWRRPDFGWPELIYESSDRACRFFLSAGIFDLTLAPEINKNE